MADPEYPFPPIKVGNPCQTCCGTCKDKETIPDLKPYANCCYETPPDQGMVCYNTKRCGACIKIDNTKNKKIADQCVDPGFSYTHEGKRLCLNGVCYSDCWKLENNNVIPNYNTVTHICCDFGGVKKPKPGTEKDSCWECKEEKVPYTDIYGAQNETSQSQMHNYCADRTDGKNSCCYGECYDPNDLCVKCDDKEKKLIPKCPPDKDSTETECCAGTCFDKNKECKVCDESTGTIITDPQCNKCCPITNVSGTTYSCCKGDTPDCCEGVGCYKDVCQQCK